MKKQPVLMALLLAIIVSCSIKRQSAVKAETLYVYSVDGESEDLIRKISDSIQYFPGNPERTLAQFKKKNTFHIFIEGLVAIDICSVNKHRYGIITDSSSTEVYEFKRGKLNFLFHFTETHLGMNVAAEPMDINNDGFQDILMRYNSGGFYGEDDICLLFNPNWNFLESTSLKFHDATFDPVARKVHSHSKFIEETYDIIGTDFSLQHREIAPDDSPDADLRRIPAIKILDRYLAEAKKLEPDSLLHPINNDSLDNFSRMITIGKFIDGEKLYAIDVDSPEENSAIDFYEYDGKWQKISTQQTADSVIRTDFMDFDGDGRKEIVLGGYYNMNGNSINEIYYVPQKGPVHYAGGFFGVVVPEYINAKEKTFRTNLEGSWYAPREFTQYEWRNEKLISVRNLVLSLKIADMKHNARWIEYYENPTSDKDTLVLKYKKTLRSKNKKQDELLKRFNVTEDDF